MRVATAAQAAALSGKYYNVGLKVLIADGDGTLQDWTTRGGTNWLDSITIDLDVDQPVSQLTVGLRRDSGSTKSLSPFRTDSTLNRNAVNAFAPAIDLARAIVIQVATVAPTASITSGDYVEIFRGTIDRIGFATSSIQIVARDIMAVAVDTWVKDKDVVYGSTEGTPLEVVIQQMLDLGPTNLMLYTPTSPGYGVTPYKQQSESVSDAVIALQQLIGWVVRGLWDEGTHTWRPTLKDPTRTKTVPDLVIGPSRYIDVTDLFVERQNIRNWIDGYYKTAGSATSTKRTVTDNGSEFKYGPRWMRLGEDQDNSPIDTEAKMLAMMNAALADLKDPKAEQEIEMHHDWRIEINDLLQFTANGVHYDTDQMGAVVTLQHRFTASKGGDGAIQARTRVRTRGAPCGGYLSWQDRSWIPIVTDPGPSLLVNVTRGDDADSIAWNGDNVTMTLDGVATALPASPFVVVHGLTDHVYTFTASANLQETSQVVFIPAGFKTGPELSYQVGDDGTVSLTVTGRRGATKTYYAFRADRRPTVSEILAGSVLGPGVRTGVVPSLVTVSPNTAGWVGAISENASGTQSDPAYCQVRWMGVGSTPVPAVTASAPTVQANLLTWQITLSATVSRIEISRAYSAVDPSPGSSAGIDVESLAAETWDFFDTSEPGVTPGVPFPVKLPLYNNSYWGLLTIIPIDALGMRGAPLNLKAQGPGSSPPTLPGKPSLAANTATASALNATVTLPGSGATINDLRQYADGKVISRTGASVGPNGSQALVYQPFAPATTHQLQVSGVTAAGVEGPLSDPITMTTTADTSGGGSGTGANGKVQAPVLYGQTYSIPDQAAVINFSFPGTPPAGAYITMYRSADGVSGWVMLSPSGVTDSPGVFYQAQSTSGDQTMYYRAIGSDGSGLYTDSDPSNVVAVTAPAGSGMIY